MIPPALTSPVLSSLPGLRHAFFTRKGGVSEGIYASLNAGPGSRDDPEAVAANRRRCAAWFELGAERLLTAYQTHSVIARVAEAPWGEPRPEGDAIVTAAPDLICAVLTADCAPVLLADPEARVVGAAHAGWKGALDGVIGSVVAAMTAQGADPARIRAAVGPCIGPESYEVGTEFLDRFVAHDPGSERFFRPGGAPDKRLFDLPAFVLLRLEQAGVREAAWIGRDTCREADAFFSNRRAFKAGEPDYGRLLSAIRLI